MAYPDPETFVTLVREELFNEAPRASNGYYYDDSINDKYHY